jgi:hypothetical protein
LTINVADAILLMPDGKLACFHAVVLLMSDCILRPMASHALDVSTACVLPLVLEACPSLLGVAALESDRILKSDAVPKSV